MRQGILLTCIGVALCSVGMAVGTAVAATKCVALNASTTCSGGFITGRLDWTATCTTNGTSVTVSGIGGCSSKDGGTMGTKSDILTEDAKSNVFKYCWCKMTSPAVSQWIFLRAEASTASCLYACGPGCAAVGLTNFADFRSAMFSDLSD